MFLCFLVCDLELSRELGAREESRRPKTWPKGTIRDKATAELISVGASDDGGGVLRCLSWNSLSSHSCRWGGHH
jgi:hypothetical protein